MVRPRRRLVMRVLLVIGIILCAMTLRLGFKWKQALDNVDAMRVVPVALPTQIPERQPVGGGTVEQQPTPEATSVPAPDDPINILLLGTDARIGEEVSRTDAIILVHLDPRADRVSMLSFPRDLWVTIPGYGKNKINAAYPIGERRIGAGYGAALAKETISEFIGVPIHHFVLINFEGFKTLIDKLGGIYIDVPKAIDDDKYPTDEYPGDLRTIKIHFDAGSQLMDGTTALIYARTRHADNDFGRNQRQQQVLLAIFDRIREQGLLTQLTSLDEYTGALRDSVRTDLSRSEMLHLAGIAPHLHAENIQRYAIGSKMLLELQRPYRLVVTDSKALKQLVNEVLGEAVASAGGENPKR